MKDKEEELIRLEEERTRGLTKRYHKQNPQNAHHLRPEDENYLSIISVNTDGESFGKSLESSTSSTSCNINAEQNHKSRCIILEKQFTRQELVELLAEAFVKRAQTILMLDHQSEEGFNMALDDAKKASMLVPSNENYKLVVATCMMRLEQLASAAATLREVIKLNPKMKVHYSMKRFAID